MSYNMYSYKHSLKKNILKKKQPGSLFGAFCFKLRLSQLAIMGMKYVSAYLMCVLGGNENPSAKDIEKVLSSVGSECDSSLAEKLVSEIKSRGIFQNVLFDGAGIALFLLREGSGV